MQFEANSVFKIVEYKMTPFSEIPEGPTLFTGNFKFHFTGDLEGEGIYSELRTKFNDNYAEIYGLQRFAGSLKGRKGSFVWEQKGNFRDGIVTTEWKVVPGSGTGQLKAIKGEVFFQSAGLPEFPFRFIYSLPAYH
jgi:hypothetical protein